MIKGFHHASCLGFFRRPLRASWFLWLLLQAGSALAEDDPLAGDVALFSSILPLEAHSHGTYSLHGFMSNNVETDFLVDTGSSYVALSRKTFEQIQRRGGLERVREIRGATASGSRLRLPVYRLDRLAFDNGCELKNIEVAVVPGDRDILGMSALTQLQPFALQTTPPRLLVSQCRPRAAG